MPAIKHTGATKGVKPKTAFNLPLTTTAGAPCLVTERARYFETTEGEYPNVVEWRFAPYYNRGRLEQ